MYFHRFLKGKVVVFAVCFFGFFILAYLPSAWNPVPPAEAWCNISSSACNSSWATRKKITLNNSDSAENLTNFPILVQLTSSNIDYSKTQNSGQDIRFVDADDSTALSYEIEKWDEAGTSLVWVKVPQIDAASTTDYIWMYYNNGSATDNQSATSVWDSNYKGVWHLGSDASFSVTDSTGNNTGTNNGTITATTGQIGTAGSFNGSNQYISTTNSIPTLSAYTACAWVKPTFASSDTSAYEIMVRQVSSSDDPLRVARILWVGSQGAWYTDSAGAYAYKITDSFSANTWRNVCFTINGSNNGGTGYVNGSSSGSSQVVYITSPNNTANASFTIGAMVGSISSSKFPGVIDEVKVSNSVRSADWVEAEYLYTLDNTKYTYGGEETNAISISGSIYSNEGSSALDCSSGGARTVRIKINGAGSYSGDCTLNTGTYSVTGITPPSAGDVITVYLDGETEKAVTVTRAAGGSNLSGLNLYQDRLIVRHEDAGPTTNANLGQYDNDDDTDLTFTSNSNNLTVEDGNKLLVWTGKTFTPGGTITTDPSASSASVDGDIGIQSSATLSMETNALSVGGDFINAGTFSESGSPHTTTFTATATGHSIDYATGNLDKIIFNGPSGGWSFADSSNTVADDLVITAGTLSGTNSITVNGGDVTGDGTINMTGGTFLVDGTGSFGGATAWTFSTLTFGDGSGSATTTASGAGGITASGVLTIAANQTLAAGSKTWTLSGASTPFVRTGTFTVDTSVFKFIGNGASTIAATTYYDLELKPSSSAQQVFASGTTTVNNNLTIGDGTNAGATAATNNPVINVAGNTTIAANATYTTGNGAVGLTGDLIINGTLSGSGTGTITAGADVVGTGTVNISGNTFQQILSSANKNFGTTSGSSTWTFNHLLFGAGMTGRVHTTQTGGSGDITVNGTLTISSANTLNAGNRVWHLVGSTPFTFAATAIFTPATSTMSYEGSGSITLATVTSYYNLQFNPSGTATYTFPQAPGGLCFLAGTEIRMADGSLKNIEDIEPGDLIKGYDLNTHEETIDTVSNVQKTISDSYYIINGNTEVTGNHIFYKADYTTSEAKDLEVGDILTTENGPVLVDSVEIVKREVEVYDLTVLPNHLFFANDYLVHNAGPLTTNVTNNFTMTGSGTATVAATNNPLVSVAGVMNIGSGQTYNTGTSNLTLSGSGTPLVIGGTFTATNGNTVRYTGTSATNIAAATYASLGIGTVSDSGTGVTYTLVGNTIVNSALTIGHASSTNSDTFSQGTSYNLTTGAVTVTTKGIWSNIGTGDVTLSGNVSNSGAITLNSNNGSQCVDGADDIVIDSSVDNTTRAWSGSGTFTMYNLNVDDMTGTGVTAYTSTLSGDTTWIAGNCDFISPVFSSFTPTTSSLINNVTSSSDISFSVDEALGSGSITITRTSGTADGASPHTCTLTGTALNVGAHTINLSDTTNSCTSNVSNLVSGTVYTFVLAGSDAANNAASSVTSTSVTFDNTPPTISEVASVPTPTNDNTPNYTFTTNEVGTISYGGDCSSATASASLGSNTITFTTLADGAHANCTITVTDIAENVSSTLAVTSFTIDTSAPTISITAPANLSTVSGAAVSVTANASDAIGVLGVQFKLDGANLGGEDTTSTYGITWDSTLIPDGSYVLTAVARDTAGNSTTSSSITVMVDNISIPTLTTLAASLIAETAATLNGSIDTTGGENPGERGFEWGHNTLYGSTITDSGSHSTGAFTGTLSSLICATEYHFRAYAENSAGTSYGTDQTFTTSACSTSNSNSSSSGSSSRIRSLTLPPEPRPPEGGYIFYITSNPTKTAYVTLHFKAGEDATHIEISDNSSFSSSTYIEYQDLSYWVLPKEGERTVYARFCNQYHVCGSTLSAKVLYDSGEPGLINKLIPDFLKPKTPSLPVELPMVRVVPPLSLEGKWNLLSNTLVENFVLSPLPSDIQKLTEKFPELDRVFTSLGIVTLNDLGKLQNTEINLPVIARGDKVPSEIILARGSLDGEAEVNVGSSIVLTSANQLQQKIKVIAGKSIVLSVKPESAAALIKGYLFFKRSVAKTTLEIPINSLAAGAVLSNLEVAQISSDSPDAELELLVHSFEYTDPDEDGLFTAELSVPVSEGEYEILTIINYQDKDKGSKSIRLITVIDPEGYVYKKNNNGEETRLREVKVSIWKVAGGVSSLWEAERYKQNNPQITNNTGKYSFLVPPGEYYIVAEAKGYKFYQSNQFEVKEGSGIHFNIELEESQSWLQPFLDWKMLIIIIFGIFLVVNFINDRRFRKKLLIK